MSQMTHFPALAPEEGSPADAPTSNNSGGGIITSFFGNIFRSAPISSSGGTAHNKPLQVTNPVNRDLNNDSILSQLYVELPANGSSANVPSQQNSNNSLPVDNRSQSSSSAQSQTSQNLQKKLSVRISSVFRTDENTAASENGGVRRFASNGLIDYQRSEFRRYWMPDSTGKECYECHEKFSAFRRRHHCRLCGQIFCGRCSNRQINGAELGYAGVLRLCMFCANQVDAHVKSRRKEESLMEPQRNSVTVTCSASPDQSAMRKTSTCSRKKSTIYRVAGTTEATSRTDDEMPEHPSVEENAAERVAEEGSSLPDDANQSFSSAYRYSPIVDEHDAFLERMFDANIERLLDSLLEREFLEPNLWKPLLLGLSRRVVNMVMPTVLKVPDALNILDFVHIKKLPTKQEPSFEIVEGVAFSKALAHSAMCTDGKNVSVMLLAGNITYERVVENLSSLETILLQEQEYLKIQVDRVTSRRVTLLLVEHSVARLAAEMLLAEGVALATGVKRRVLERVARSTNADIVTSLDAQFLQPRVGFVPDFAQREFTLVDGSTKKILTFDNCFGEFGVSVLLHGPSLKELVAAKRVLKFLLVTCFSTRLECAFLALFNSRPGVVQYPALYANESENITENLEESNTEGGDNHPLKRDKAIDSGLEAKNAKDSSRRCFDCALCEFNRQCEAEDDTNLSEFVRHFRRLQLTNSPAIRFAPPYLETEAGRGCALTPYFRSPLFRFVGADDLEMLRADEQRLRDELMRIIERNNGRKAENQRLRHAMLEGDVLTPSILLDAGRWAQFRSQSALLFRRRHELNAYSEWKKFFELRAALKRRQEAELRGDVDDAASARTAHLYANASLDALSAYDRQRIAFLYCANARKSSTTARTFCIGPYVLLRQFFFGQESGHKDTGLGSFLVNYCFNTDYKCSGCERSMMDHLRRIVHRNARVEITTHVVSQRTSAILSSSASVTLSGATGGGAASGNGGGGGVAPPQPPDGELNLDELPSSIPNMNCSSIICWRRCPRCAANSCIVPLPDTVFHLSFAKFIDYLVNGTYWTSNFPAAFCGGHRGAPSRGTAGETCRHCTFHEHTHFFAHYNHVTCFRVVPIRPLHVVFTPLVCRIQPERVLCSELIEANYELNSMASDVFERALSSFRDYHCVTDSPLLSFVEQFKTMFRSQMGKFDPDGMFKRSKLVESNNAYYLQSAACLMRCRYLLHSFIVKWNTTRSDPNYHMVVDTSAVAVAAISSAAAIPLIGASAVAGATAETNSSTASLRRGNALTNDCPSNKFDGEVGDGSGGEDDAKAEKTENSGNDGFSNGVVDGNAIFGDFASSGGATNAAKDTAPMRKSASARLSENGDAGGSLPLELVSGKPTASSTVTPTATTTTTVVVTSMKQLPSIDNPLPPHLHFELSMNSSMILVRDWPSDASKSGGGGATSAGNCIDIGSLIAYALASPDYEDRRNGRRGAAANAEADCGNTSFCELSFSGGGNVAESRSIQFSVKVYFPDAFEQMRSTLFGDGEEQFRRSLSRTVPWHPQGGKSGANFFRTEDERFIIKQLSRFELESFKKCGPKYLDYVGAALRERKLTALCKIFGVYGIQFTGRAQPSIKMDVLVMEYLFYRRGVRQIWDLKGSLRNRYASTKHDAASVLLDENLVQDLWGNQLYVHPYSKAALNQAIINDSHFLSTQGIMDYSLLAGICQDNDEVVIGIVDYMRTYTLDKKVESLVKTALPIAHSPTVVSPELYRKRFYEAIDGYFAIAPDQWTHTTEVPLKQ